MYYITSAGNQSITLLLLGRTSKYVLSLRRSEPLYLLFLEGKSTTLISLRVRRTCTFMTCSKNNSNKSYNYESDIYAINPTCFNLYLTPLSLALLAILMLVMMTMMIASSLITPLRFALPLPLLLLSTITLKLSAISAPRGALHGNAI